MKQDDTILNHLRTKGPITSIDAIHLYGITRLAAVVHRLRKQYNIESEMIDVDNRHGDTVTVAKYWLVRQPKQTGMFPDAPKRNYQGIY